MTLSEVKVPNELPKWARERQTVIERLNRTHSHLNKKPRTIDFGFSTDLVWFRRMIGNPVSKITNLEQDMAPFQVDYHNAIQDFHWIIPLKSRKLGATETAITSIALNCFDRYIGHDIMIVAGNEVRVAKEILLRFYEFFEDREHKDGIYAFRGLDPTLVDKRHPWQKVHAEGHKYHYDDFIKSAHLSQDPTITFTNGTRVMAFAASRQEKAQTFRGADDVICIFLSEAAHTGMKTDQPIMNALEPNLAQRDDGDFILESTGNGRRGFFHDYWMYSMEVLAKQYRQPVTRHQILVNQINNDWKHGRKIKAEVDWFPLMWDYHVGLQANILSKKFIDKEKRNPKIDFAQEYECAFTSTYSAAIDTTNIIYKDPNAKDYVASIDYSEFLKEET